MYRIVESLLIACTMRLSGSPLGLKYIINLALAAWILAYQECPWDQDDPFLILAVLSVFTSN